MGHDHAQDTEVQAGRISEAFEAEGPPGDSAGLGDPGQGPSRNGDSGVREPLKIAIVGTAPGWEEAPFDDPSWQVWSLSRAYTFLPRYDAWFELHKLDEVCKTWEPGNEAEEAAHRRAYIEWLSQQQIPVFVREPRPELPNATVYPTERVLEAFTRRYFTNTISWMLALAIMADPDAIGVWGVDMELSSEYGHQRPSLEYFVGIADGKGIPVHIPERSDICKARKLYAVEDDRGFNAKIAAKREHLHKINKALKQQLFETQIQMAGNEGALEMIEYVAEAWER